MTALQGSLRAVWSVALLSALLAAATAQAQQQGSAQGLRPLLPGPGSTVPPATLPAGGARRGLSLAQASWTYEPPTEPKQFKLNDQLTVVVSEKSVFTSEGQMDRRKQADGHLTLSDWLSLNNWSIRPAPQLSGDPKIAGEMQNKYRAQANLETRDLLTFKITVRIVDIRPNGTLVVEGNKSVHANIEAWDACLTGVVRPEDVLPNNTVLSENVGDLRIIKRETGHVRDGYRRGWLLELLDRYQLF